MKIQTYNILHGMDYSTKVIDLSKTADTVKAISPDILVLNEVRGRGPLPGYTDQAREIAKYLGMNYYFAPSIMVGGTSPYGNAIMSRFPITNTKCIPIPDPKVKRKGGRYETRSVICADILTPEGVLKVYGTHFGLEEDEQANALATVRELIKNGPAVLMGDLNTEPHSRIIHGLKEFLFDTGELIAPCKKSYPSYSPDVKIDYIFTTGDIEVLDADIIPMGYSDHLPYWAEIKLPGTK